LVNHSEEKPIKKAKNNSATLINPFIS